MINEVEVKERIRDAMATLEDFWEADEEDQLKAMETALRCMQILLQLIN